MMPPAPAGGLTHTSLMPFTPLATGLELVVSPKRYLPLAYRRVQVVRGQGGR